MCLIVARCGSGPGELCSCECYLRVALNSYPWLFSRLSWVFLDPMEKWWGPCVLLPGWKSCYSEFYFFNTNAYSLSCREIEHVQFYPNGWCRIAVPVGQPLFLITMMRKCFHLKRKMLEWFSHPLPLLLASKRIVGALGLSQAKGGILLGASCWNVGNTSLSSSKDLRKPQISLNFPTTSLEYSCLFGLANFGRASRNVLAATIVCSSA